MCSRVDSFLAQEISSYLSLHKIDIVLHKFGHMKLP